MSVVVVVVERSSYSVLSLVVVITNLMPFDVDSIEQVQGFTDAMRKQLMDVYAKYGCKKPPNAFDFDKEADLKEANARVEALGHRIVKLYDRSECVMGVLIGPEQGTDFYALAMVARNGEHNNAAISKQKYLSVATSYYPNFARFTNFSPRDHLGALIDMSLVIDILANNIIKSVGYLHPTMANVVQLEKSRKAAPARQEKKRKGAEGGERHGELYEELDGKNPKRASRRGRRNSPVKCGRRESP